MVLGYHKSNDGRVSDDEHRRVIAVNAALEIIKSAVSTPENSRNIAYELDEALKYLPKIADAIQSAIEKK